MYRMNLFLMGVAARRDEWREAGCRMGQEIKSACRFRYFDVRIFIDSPRNVLIDEYYT